MPPKKRNREDQEEEIGVQVKAEAEDVAELKQMLNDALKKNDDLQQEKEKMEQERDKNAKADRVALLLKTAYESLLHCRKAPEGWDMYKNPHAFAHLIKNIDPFPDPESTHRRVVVIDGFSQLLQIMRNPVNPEDQKPYLNDPSCGGIVATSESFFAYVMVIPKGSSDTGVDREEEFSCVFACIARRNDYFHLALNYQLDPAEKCWVLDPIWEKSRPQLQDWWTEPFPSDDKVVKNVVPDCCWVGNLYIESGYPEMGAISSGLVVFWEHRDLFDRLYPSGAITWRSNERHQYYELDPTTMIARKLDERDGQTLSQSSMSMGINLD